MTLILGNLSYPGKPARRSARDRRIVRLATVSNQISHAKNPRHARVTAPKTRKSAKGNKRARGKGGIMLANISASPISASRLGNEARKNPPRRVRVPIKQCGVACAEIAKKPNRKACCVDRPAEDFGSHLTAPLAALVRPREALMTPPSRTP